MSRIDLAQILLVVVGVAGAVFGGFLIILYRERRKRAYWSTRTRASRPHWSITLAEKFERLTGRLSDRRRPHRRRRKQDL